MDAKKGELMPVDTNLLKGYQTALALAVESFRAADPSVLASRCGAEFDSSGMALRLDYLRQPYLITWPDGDIKRADSHDEVPVTTKVLLLNYVLSARAHAPTGELIAFRDLPGAAIYEPSFEKRAVAPLARTFDGKPDALVSAANQLGGTESTVADVSVSIRVLPLLDIIYGVWYSDEEFPARGAILFDSSVRRLMSAECMVVAASNGVYRLIGLSKGSE